MSGQIINILAILLLSVASIAFPIILFNDDYDVNLYGIIGGSVAIYGGLTASVIYYWKQYIKK